MISSNTTIKYHAASLNKTIQLFQLRREDSFKNLQCADVHLAICGDMSGKKVILHCVITNIIKSYFYHTTAQQHKNEYSKVQFLANLNNLTSKSPQTNK